MREITDLAKVKEKAILFLHLEPKPVKSIDFLVDYPFLDTMFGYVRATGKMFNVFSDKEGFAQYKEEMEQFILSRENVWQVVNTIRKSYRLTFFKYVNEYLSVRDFTENLKEVWVLSEFPSRDVNVTKKEFAAWFKVADKTILMDEDEIKKYNSFPETVQIYRGVASDAFKAGLSWSLSREKAEWFASRFEFEDCQPVVYSFEINKSDILAYISERGESEVIIDPAILKNYKVNISYL